MHASPRPPAWGTGSESRLLPGINPVPGATRGSQERPRAATHTGATHENTRQHHGSITEVRSVCRGHPARRRRRAPPRPHPAPPPPAPPPARQPQTQPPLPPPPPPAPAPAPPPGRPASYSAPSPPPPAPHAAPSTPP